MRGRRRAPRALVVAFHSACLLACQGPASVVPGPLPLSHCESAAEVAHSVFLIGDAGAPRLPRHAEAKLPVEPVLRGLRADVTERVGALGVDRVSVVFLGDNVYPRGLVAPGAPGRSRGERILEMQIVSAAAARAIFTAGNHDWDRQGPDGWENVRHQHEFLAARGERVEMLPEGGCLGPERRDFGPHLRFVFVDPIGYGHAVEFPEKHAAACRHDSILEAYLALSREFDAPGPRHLVLAMHPPLVSSGPHGGHFTWKEHLFPLTEFVPWLWLPLPVIGSIYPLSRQLGVTETDLSSGAYQGWIRGVYRATRPKVPLLFVGGHEHSLQLHRDAIGAYYAVSGAGSAGKVDRVTPRETSMFSLAAPGYMRLDVHGDGALELTVLALDGDSEPRPVMSHCLADGPPGR